MNEDGCIEYREFVPAAVELIITLQTQKTVAMNKVSVSYSKCLSRRFAKVNSRTNPSTYPLLLLISQTS